MVEWWKQALRKGAKEHWVQGSSEQVWVGRECAEKQKAMGTGGELQGPVFESW
jgi:hypothetical protein